MHLHNIAYHVSYSSECFITLFHRTTAMTHLVFRVFSLRFEIFIYSFDASFGGCTIFHVALLWQVTSYFHLNISGMCFRWNYWMYISLQITLMHGVMIFINREVAQNSIWKRWRYFWWILWYFQFIEVTNISGYQN